MTELFKEKSIVMIYDKSSGKFVPTQLKKGLSTGGSAFETLKNTLMMPMPETQRACVQNSSYKNIKSLRLLT